MGSTPNARPELERVRLPEDASFVWKEVGGRQFTAPFHHHAEMEVTAIHAGHGMRFTGDVVEPFQAGELVVLGPHLPHAWFCAAECRRAEATVVQFHAQTLGAGVLAAREMEPVRGLLEAARGGVVFPHEGADGPAGQLQALGALPPAARLAALLGLLARLAEHGGRPLGARAPVETVSAVDRERLDVVLRLMHTRSAEPLTQAAVARQAGLGPEAFSRFFRRVTGRTFIETLTDIRLAGAMARLRQGSEKVAAIAAACGFEDLSHFNRQFRKRYGCAPGAARKG